MSYWVGGGRTSVSPPFLLLSLVLLRTNQTVRHFLLRHYGHRVLPAQGHRGQPIGIGGLEGIFDLERGRVGGWVGGWVGLGRVEGMGELSLVVIGMLQGEGGGERKGGVAWRHPGVHPRAWGCGVGG